DRLIANDPTLFDTVWMGVYCRLGCGGRRGTMFLPIATIAIVLRTIAISTGASLVTSGSIRKYLFNRRFTICHRAVLLVPLVAHQPGPAKDPVYLPRIIGPKHEHLTKGHIGSAIVILVF